MPSFHLSLWVVCLMGNLYCPVYGFVVCERINLQQKSTTTTTTTAPFTSRRFESPSSLDRESMQRDIADLNLEASHRLDALMEQMDALQQLNNNHNNNDMSTSTSRQQQQHDSSPSKENSKLLETTTTLAPPTQSSAAAAAVTDDNDDALELLLASALSQASSSSVHSLDLLDDSVWKVVYNIGREEGTWMPNEWGASGGRLLFQCTLHFTSEPAIPAASAADSFFQGAEGNIKVLKVTDAFLMPCSSISSSTSSSSSSSSSATPKQNAFVGRRPLPVLPTGAYKVCRGQGPAGTDLLRFFIQLSDDDAVVRHDDVSCPNGRVYGTCGYFASSPATVVVVDPVSSNRLLKKDDNNKLKSSLGSKKNGRPLRVRDIRQQQHEKAVRDCVKLQTTVDEDSHPIWDPDHWRNAQALWQAQAKVEKAAAQLRVARVREPERSKLRYTPSESVGITAEGGVCCKVHHGLALEYHILGRLQVACIAQGPLDAAAAATAQENDSELSILH